MATVRLVQLGYDTDRVPVRCYDQHNLFILLIGQFLNGVTNIYWLSEAFITRLKVSFYSLIQQTASDISE